MKAFLIGIFGGLTFFAILMFNVYKKAPTVPSETDYNKYKIEGCKAIVQELYFESKLLPIYTSDANAWCTQNYKVDNE